MRTISKAGQRNLPDSHTSFITGCVSADEKNLIDQLAAKRGLKRSALVREALRLYLSAA